MLDRALQRPGHADIIAATIDKSLAGTRMALLEQFGELKFPDAGLIASSNQRRWHGVAAELRAHPAGMIPAICPTHMEVTLAVDAVAGGVVERRGDGRFQSTPVRAGTLWFCPIGVHEDSIRITERLPRILHMYLPSARFIELSADMSRPISPNEIFYLADVDDELVRQVGFRVLAELENESAGGALLVEHLATTLILQLMLRYSSHGADGETPPPAGALDKRRLDRVLDYVEDNLDSDLSLSELAAVACLSVHHFARAFRAATGTPPHRFVSARRLLLAQRMLKDPRISLSEIAIACNFSSQATFTRAFQRHVGSTPGEFRKAHRSKLS